MNKDIKKIADKCKCVPHGMCLRCAKMTIEAHSKGYDHALSDIEKVLEGKKPTDRSKSKKFEQITTLLTENERVCARCFKGYDAPSNILCQIVSIFLMLKALYFDNHRKSILCPVCLDKVRKEAVEGFGEYLEDKYTGYGYKEMYGIVDDYLKQKGNTK